MPSKSPLRFKSGSSFGDQGRNLRSAASKSRSKFVVTSLALPFGPLLRANSTL